MKKKNPPPYMHFDCMLVRCLSQLLSLLITTVIICCYHFPCKKGEKGGGCETRLQKPRRQESRKASKHKHTLCCMESNKSGARIQLLYLSNNHQLVASEQSCFEKYLLRKALGQR